MPLLVGVPNYEGVRIYSGNTAANTSGCLSVGFNSVVGALTQSKPTFDRLFKILSETKEVIVIVIT